jgi:hypothetical protein
VRLPQLLQPPATNLRRMLLCLHPHPSAQQLNTPLNLDHPDPCCCCCSSLCSRHVGSAITVCVYLGNATCLVTHAFVRKVVALHTSEFAAPQVAKIQLLCSAWMVHSTHIHNGHILTRVAGLLHSASTKSIWPSENRNG